MNKFLTLVGAAVGGALVTFAVLEGGASARPAEAQAPAAKQESSVTVVDRCCYDLDGGGKGDDGVLSVTIHGDILMSAIYEDPDGDKKFDKRDDIKAITLGNEAWQARNK